MTTPWRTRALSVGAELPVLFEVCFCGCQRNWSARSGRGASSGEHVDGVVNAVSSGRICLSWNWRNLYVCLYFYRSNSSETSDETEIYFISNLRVCKRNKTQCYGRLGCKKAAPAPTTTQMVWLYFVYNAGTTYFKRFLPLTYSVPNAFYGNFVRILNYKLSWQKQMLTKKTFSSLPMTTK